MYAEELHKPNDNMSVASSVTALKKRLDIYLCYFLLVLGIN